MNRSIVAIALALAALPAGPAIAGEAQDSNLVAVNSPAFSAQPAPVKAHPVDTAAEQSLLQPLLDQMAQDLAGKVDQHVDASLTAAER